MRLYRVPFPYSVSHAAGRRKHDAGPLRRDGSALVPLLAFALGSFVVCGPGALLLAVEGVPTPAQPPTDEPDLEPLAETDEPIAEPVFRPATPATATAETSPRFRLVDIGGSAPISEDPAARWWPRPSCCPVRSQLTGRPLTLLGVLSSGVADPQQRLEMTHAYWRLVEAVGRYHFALDYDTWLRQLQTRDDETAPLRAARGMRRRPW